ncbi:hypothetical protein [Bowmanella denitrificans]|uniref:hypothetical protein n=1 Tax=Bowmanella denitrificans TaxID=366582 RepID=UPI000C9B0CC0|nr:hypothetical protein [Bowmanella denitrificans]
MHQTEQDDWLAMGFRYVRGELSGHELDKFEDYLMDNPELLEQLELDSVFASVLPKLELVTVKPDKGFNLWRWLFTTPIGASLSASLGTACACVLLAALLWPNSSTQIPAISASNQLVHLGTLRSTSQPEKIIELSDKKTQLILVVQPVSFEDENFLVNIKSSSTGSETSLTASISASGDIVVLIPSQALVAGKYQLNITGLTSGITQESSFHLNRRK